MEQLLDVIRQPWHWAIGGLAIALISIVLTLMGKAFGVSTAFKILCSYAGAGKKSSYFDIDVKGEGWRIYFVIGGIVGGYITANWLASPSAVAISDSTVAYLAELGLAYPESDSSGLGFVPTALFNYGSIAGIILALIGGFFVGFGSRYGEGCTSGHAITGLAHFQLPSLVTVIGFFIGGLIMTWFVLPYLIPQLL
jgi:uncharacterized protein